MHPLVRILCLVAFAISLQFVRWPALLLVCGLLALLLAWHGLPIFLKLARRARWLLLSILLIYAYATPGEYIPRVPDLIAPTYEGLRAAAMQMGRLLAMLAALSVLLASSSREDVMVGVYLLLQPLRPLGLDPERFSARLWLTLHYVETMPKGVLHRLREQGWRLDDVLQENVERPAVVEMQFPGFTAADAGVLLLIPLMVWLLV